MAEKTEKIKYKPIVATAIKVDSTPKGEDVLQVNIPFEDDQEILDDAKKAQINNNTKINIKEGKMSIDEIKNVVDERLKDVNFQKNIQTIHANTATTSKKVDEINNDVTGLKSRFDKITEKQTETCDGINCIKDDISNIKSETSKRFDDINNLIMNINGKLETATCPRCNANIPVLSSFCPNCGKGISSWEDHPDWRPYSKRGKPL